MIQKQTTAKGFAILSISGIINKLLALAYLPIQTAIVGNYGNGIINSGYKIYIFMFSLSTAGLPVAISKLISEQNARGNYENSHRIFRISLVFLLFLGIFFGVVMAASAGWISEQISQPKAYLMIVMLSPTFVFTAVSSAIRGYFQGNLNMYPTAVSQIIEQALNSLLTVVFAALLIKYGVEKAAAGTTIGTSVGAMGTAIFLVILFLRTRRGREKEPKNTKDTSGLSNRDIVRQILLYSLPAIIGTVATNSGDLIDLKFGVSRMIAGGIDHIKATELFGIYSNQFQRIINLSLSLTAAMSTAIIPAISTADATGSREMLINKVNRSFKAIFIYIIPCVIGIAALAQPIITFIFFSFKYNQGADLIMAGSWTAVLMAIICIQTAVMIGLGKPYIPPVNLILGMTLKIVVNYYIVSIPAINIKGAILGTAAGWLVACALNHRSIKKHAGFSVNYAKYIAKPLKLSVIMGILAFATYSLLYFLLRHFLSGLLLNDLCLIIAIAVAVFAYLFMLIITGALESSDIIQLPYGENILNALCRIKIIKNKLGA